MGFSLRCQQTWQGNLSPWENHLKNGGFSIAIVSLDTIMNLDDNEFPLIDGN